MITHKEYMADSKALHQAYYLEIAKDAGLRLNFDMVVKAKRALAEGDYYLNTIPLAQWDMLSGLSSVSIGRACKAHGAGGYSLGNGVCAYKALARDLAKTQA